MLHTACVAVLRRHPHPCRTSGILSYGVRSRKHQTHTGSCKRPAAQVKQQGKRHLLSEGAFQCSSLESHPTRIMCRTNPRNMPYTRTMWQGLVRLRLTAAALSTWCPWPKLEPRSKASFDCAQQQQRRGHNGHAYKHRYGSHTVLGVELACGGDELFQADVDHHARHHAKDNAECNVA